MSYGGAGDDGLSKNHRREAAREKARTLREEQRKKDRRSRFVLQGSLIVVSLAIIAVIVVVQLPGAASLSRTTEVVREIERIADMDRAHSAQPRDSDPQHDGLTTLDTTKVTMAASQSLAQPFEDRT